MNHISIERKAQCCGCGACINICPKNALKMCEDEAGFIFPVVDEKLCIDCGACLKVCGFEKAGSGANPEPEVFAAVIKDKAVLEQSSSGGIFSALAGAVLDKGGAVFGAAWSEGLKLNHICVENKEELQRLRGSKYVQSNTADTFRQVKKLLKEGRYVCFSGTPCQISGLKSYLGKDDEKLITVDIICHGVPNIKMLRDDIRNLTHGHTEKVKNIRFRDKTYGWGVKGSVSAGGKKIKYDAGSSPYYFYFLKGEVYRESCYNCRYPSEGRQGDITLGDYWGIRAEVINRLGNINPDKGISAVLVNTEKGKKWFKDIENNFFVTPSDRAAVEKRNKQLTAASTPLAEHKQLLDGYTKSGYGVFLDGYKKYTKEHIIRGVKNIIPPAVKRKINDLLS